MAQSILEESRQARGGIFRLFRRRQFLIAAAILIIAGGGAYYAYSRQTAPVATVQAVKRATAKKEDLKISISSDGKVVAKDGVVLSFPVSGNLEVSEVNVKEGDRVKKGDKIAAVKTESLEFELRNAYASYQSALANYNAKMDGATDSELAKAKASVEQAQVSLDQAKISLDKTKSSGELSVANAQTALDDAADDLARNKDVASSESVRDAYFSLANNVKSVSVTLQKALHDSDLIVGVDDTMANYEFKDVLGAKVSTSLSRAQDSYKSTKELKVRLDNALVGLDSSNRAAVDAAADLAGEAIDELQSHLYNMQVMLDASVTSVNLSQSKLDSFKSTISGNRSGATSASSSLDNAVRAASDSIINLKQFQTAYDKAVRNLESAKSQAEQDKSNAEISVRSREISLDQAKNDLSDLQAPPEESEIASARSQLTSASVSVDRARYNVEQATLTSPIDGVVSMLNYKAGDIILSDGAKSMATIINNDTLFIEANIEEADISKLKVGQKARATFDAADGKTLEGEVSFISLTSSTSSNGIVTYLVRIILADTADSGIREGMTASVDFITAEAPGVLAIPVEAVHNISGQPSVELADGTIAPVVTGFTDGKKVEVISGLQEGDTVLY